MSPIRLDFDQHSKSGAITIRNEAKNELKVQIALYEWTQDEQGKDHYRKSDALLYFPRLAKIGSGESRVVRVGVRHPPVTNQEKQYRMYVEELPAQAPQQGTALAVAVRFGVPLFIKPTTPDAAGSIENIAMENGRLRIRVRNSGNVHFKIATIEAVSGERYAEQINGWYLLPGAVREHVITIPEALCLTLEHLDIKVKADLLELQDALTVTPAMCRK